MATAIHTYRRPDAPGEHRSSEQATADAVVEALRGALRFDQDTTEHGARPQVVVHISWSELCAAAGVAETTYSGAVPAREVRRLLDDAAISRLITGPDSLPLDTGRATRNVGVGIWKALLARDGGCTYPGCDAPPAWCDGAHLAAAAHRHPRPATGTDRAPPANADRAPPAGAEPVSEHARRTCDHASRVTRETDGPRSQDSCSAVGRVHSWPTSR